MTGGTGKRAQVRELYKGDALGGVLVAFGSDHVNVPLNASGIEIKSLLESMTTIPSLNDVIVLNHTANEVKWYVDFGLTFNGTIEELSVNDEGVFWGRLRGARVFYSSTMSSR